MEGYLDGGFEKAFRKRINDLLGSDGNAQADIIDSVGTWAMHWSGDLSLRAVYFNWDKTILN